MATNMYEGAYICSTSNCGYMYIPSKGDRKGKISPDTPFEELPGDWRCPVCGASKKAFRPMQEAEETDE